MSPIPRISRSIGFLLLAVVSLQIYLPVFAQAVPSLPILRIEIGTHTAKLTEISSDFANRYLVTVSDDKTARVWDMASGELLRVLRLPIGPNKEGMLYAVSMSPDGDSIAVGGWTAIGSSRNHSIYIFDRATGAIRSRMDGLEDVVFSLSYSLDGSYLAATIAGKFGVRLFETKGYTKVGEDRNYGGPSEWVDFDPNSKQLVTTSFDGFVRKYDISNQELQLIGKSRMPGDKVPVGVEFSPDGSKLAIGYLNSTQVSVLSSVDLSILYEVDNSNVPPTSGSYKPFLPVVGWSSDGNTLYAAGTSHRVNSEFLISKWTDSGRSYLGIPAFNGAIYDIEVLKSGGIAFSGPSGWGLLNSDNKTVCIVSSKIGDFREVPDRIISSEDPGARKVIVGEKNELLTNTDSSIIQFGYRRGQTMQFSLKARKLEQFVSLIPELNGPTTISRSFRIADWKNKESPSFNDKLLRLDANETSRSLSILPGQKAFVLGTEWYLRKFDDSGVQMWKTAVPDVAWRLNSSADGRVLVAALSDGTIRWYRTVDGNELLALFAPDDGSQRWVLWTPSGYFDASPNSEDLIGWHVNNGPDTAADFFPNHLFRHFFFRPDIIDRVLETVDESLAIELANQKAGKKDAKFTIARVLPPVVEIMSAIKGSTSSTVSLTYLIRSHTQEPITALKLTLDGREVKLTNKQKLQVGTNKVNFEVQSRDSTITLSAQNRFTTSVPVSVKLNGLGKSE